MPTPVGGAVAAVAPDFRTARPTSRRSRRPTPSGPATTWWRSSPVPSRSKPKWRDRWRARRKARRAARGRRLITFRTVLFV